MSMEQNRIEPHPFAHEHGMHKFPVSIFYEKYGIDINEEDSKRNNLLR